MATKVMLDIDGVLTVSWQPLPGAVDALRWLEGEEIGFRLVTNTSSKSRLQIAALLARAGMEVELEQIQTAVTSAARYLVDTYPGAPCLFLNEGDVDEDLEGVGVVDAGRADVILLGGAGPSVGYDELDAAFKRAIDGVPVVALHRNTRYQTDRGPALDMGAFIVGLEAAASIEVTVVGKPAAAFFEAALSELGADPGSTVMVGDDLVSDVLGAQAVGITGVLVRTGKFRPSDLDQISEAPDHVIGDVGDLPGLLAQLSDVDEAGRAGAGRVAP
jgi:HAD superfamily hydrolase (TIGR01458 family)